MTRNNSKIPISPSLTPFLIRLLRSFGTIVDTLNPLRNKASIAHPNKALLSEPEAILVINAVRTILHYFDEKIFRHSQSEVVTEEANAT